MNQCWYLSPLHLPFSISLLFTLIVIKSRVSQSFIVYHLMIHRWWISQRNLKIIIQVYWSFYHTWKNIPDILALFILVYFFSNIILLFVISICLYHIFTYLVGNWNMYIIHLSVFFHSFFLPPLPSTHLLMPFIYFIHACSV